MIQALRGLERQFSVLVAVTRRELGLRIAHRSLGWIEEVASITAHTLAFTFMRLLMGATNHHGMAVIPFTFTGVMIYWLFKTGITSTYSAPAALLRYSEFPQVTLLDVAMGRAAANTVIYISFAFSAFMLLALFNFSPFMNDAISVLVWLLAAAAFGFTSGLVLMWPAYVFPAFRTVVMAVMFRLVSLVSGTFFVYSDLPLMVRQYAIWFPLLYINDKLREAYFATFSAAWASPDYVALWLLCTLGLGLVCCDIVRRKMKTH